MSWKRLPGVQESSFGEGDTCPIPKTNGSWNLLKLTYCLRHQELSKMILFLLFQRRVLFPGWLRSKSNRWFAKIVLETCCGIRFELFKTARFHDLPLK